ncbi:hypothetical protein M9H77_35934 [Catharanthus roseus]|uniref:Uncharacterized protein n=1 Tax=Catharanthus roseus TaxID=4058 RepID=A0ACB9ZRC6_CATRO|nr:hypothetical protein M9H77_35934 [Catharanthus roseus]
MATDHQHSNNVGVSGLGRKTKANGDSGGGGGKPLVLIICGGLVYYHCAFRNSSLVSLVSDVFTVLLCSLAILGLLFRQMNIQVPVNPLEWQISQETANAMFACLANTIGAAESVLRVAATGHDKRFFIKVVTSLYLLSAVGRVVSGATVAFAGILTPLLSIGFTFLLLSFFNVLVYEYFSSRFSYTFAM